MALAEQELRECTREWARREFRGFRRTANMDDDQLLAAARAAEAWLIEHAKSFRVAMPEPFLSRTDNAQKAMLVAGVLKKLARRGD